MSDKKHIIANKYHHDNGVKFREMKGNKAILLSVVVYGELQDIWIPKSICTWDIKVSSGDVHIYVEEWWYNKNADKFE